MPDGRSNDPSIKDVTKLNKSQDSVDSYRWEMGVVRRIIILREKLWFAIR